MRYSCPACGWKTDTLPDAVKIKIDRAARLVEMGRYESVDDVPGERYVYHSKGHSDMSTHVCPKCEHEGWFQGWVMEGTPEA